MLKNLHISNIFSTFASYNKAYDKGRVNQRNTAETAAFGAGRKSSSGV